jgi:predicted type IV restriction endonuclease
MPKKVKELNFPIYTFRTRSYSGQIQLFDEVRKKWIVLTPEEWVRQHLIHFLRSERGFPLSLMAVEKQIEFNGRKGRFDLVLYNNKGQPQLLAECKAPEIEMTQAVFDQAARYNITMRVPYLLVTNGLIHHCCQIDFATESYSFLSDIPDSSVLS